MLNLNPQVDQFLADGCGRCKYHATPQCKVNTWREELETLRQIVLECGLTEEIKWGMPTYTHGGKNVVMVNAFKAYAALSFFKGMLLDDPAKLLQKHGESSQSAQSIRFTDVATIHHLEQTLKSYIQAAIALEESGAKVAFNKNPETIPDELAEKFDQSPDFKKAFYSLTPGRQRGYILYFKDAKQAQTRHNRIEKYMDKIMQGQGMLD